MPAIGPVYQPTTYNVGYEPQSEWAQQPRRGRFSKFLDWIQSDECLRIVFLISTIIVAGFIFYLSVEGIMFMLLNSHFIYDRISPFVDFLLYIFFVAFIISSCILLFAMYLRFFRNKRFYFWPFISKEGLTSSQCRNGQAMVLNPSTDLLVTPAQYGPIIEPPPTMHEEDETKNLMGNENKEINEETEERPNDADPRIVLRPPGHRDDA